MEPYVLLCTDADNTKKYGQTCLLTLITLYIKNSKINQIFTDPDFIQLKKNAAAANHPLKVVLF